MDGFSWACRLLILGWVSLQLGHGFDVDQLDDAVQDSNPECVASVWGQWAQCSKMCAGGTTTRQREIKGTNSPACPSKQREECNSAPCDKPLQVRRITASSETKENPASGIWLETTGSPPPPPGASWNRDSLLADGSPRGLASRAGGWIAESTQQPVRVELDLRKPSVVRSVEIGWKFGSPSHYQVVLTKADDPDSQVDDIGTRKSSERRDVEVVRVPPEWDRQLVQKIMLLISAPPAGQGSALGIDFITVYGQKVPISNGTDCQTSGWSCMGGCSHVEDRKVQTVVQTRRVPPHLNTGDDWSCEVKQKDIDGCAPAVCSQKPTTPPAGVWPTTAPTRAPTTAPTNAPTSHAPTTAPTPAPTTPAPTTPAPTTKPTTDSPTTASPSTAPTESPTTAPSTAPSDAPSTFGPSAAGETYSPSAAPITFGPTEAPSTAPSTAPTGVPTLTPTGAPTTHAPTRTPTGAPTTHGPTLTPTDAPTPCGDGEKLVTETCDDGNRKDGDGCSSKCKVEQGFTCWSSSRASSCVSQKQFESQLMAVTVRGHHKCKQQKLPGFLLQDPVTGAGKCTATGPQQLPRGFSSDQYQYGGGLFMSDTITSRVTVSVTRKHKMSLHPSDGGESGEPYAVCRSTRVSACGTTFEANSTHCVWAGSTECLEVCLPAKYCGTSELHPGTLVLRNHSHLQGEVCIFRNCKVPASWSLMNKQSMQPSDWCSAVAERGADGDRVNPRKESDDEQSESDDEQSESESASEAASESESDPVVTTLLLSEAQGEIKSNDTSAAATSGDEAVSLVAPVRGNSTANQAPEQTPEDEMSPGMKIAQRLLKMKIAYNPDQSPTELRANAQHAAANANYLLSKWDDTHSQEKQLSRAEAEYWASEAEADAGEKPGAVAGMSSWELARALTAGAVEQVQMAHKEAKKLQLQAEKTNKSTLVVTLAERSWRAEFESSIKDLVSEVNVDIKQDIEVNTEAKNATESNTTSADMEKSADKKEKFSLKTDLKWLKMHRGQTEHLEKLSQLATDSVATAEQEIANLAGNRSKIEIATLQMLEKSKADQAAFGQLLKKATAHELAESAELAHLKALNEEARERAEGKSKETVTMAEALKKHAEMANSAAEATAQLLAAEELKSRKEQATATMGKEASEEHEDLQKIIQTEQHVKLQIAEMRAAATGENSAKHQADVARAAEFESRDQSRDKHEQALAQQLKVMEQTWRSQMTSQLRQIETEEELLQDKLNETKAQTRNTQMELQKMEISCTAQLDAMPADRQSMIHQILTQDRARAKLLRGAEITEMELQVEAVDSRQAVDMHQLQELHAQLAAAELKMEQQKVPYDILQRELGVVKKKLQPCELSVWSAFGACSAKCDRGIQKRQRQVVQSGKGCSEEPLTDERHCMINECEVCGDGRKVDTEACDDGNIKDGDGCSHECEVEKGWSCDGGSGCSECGDGVISGSEECEAGTGGASGCTDCKLDPGFTWVGGIGALSCVPTDQWQEDVNDRLSRGVAQCARQEGPSYWEVAKAASGEGACVETPNEIEGPARSMLETSIEADAAAGATAAAQGGLILSADFAEQLANPKLDTAFAVCKANRVQVCAMASVDTMPKPIRRCLSQARYDCVEVNVDASYCDSQEAKELGAVKTSPSYGSQTDMDGQVCVLKGCNVPSSWHLLGRSNSSQIQPAAWCFEVGTNAGVLHYLV